MKEKSAPRPDPSANPIFQKVVKKFLATKPQPKQAVRRKPRRKQKGG